MMISLRAMSRNAAIKTLNTMMVPSTSTRMVPRRRRRRAHGRGGLTGLVLGVAFIG